MSDTETLAKDTLSGDLRDYLLAQVKSWSETPWGKRPAADQRSIAHQIEAKSRDIVRDAVELIAANRCKPVRGFLVRAAAKEKLQLTIDVIRTEDGRHDLIDGVGSTILLIAADAEQYYGERAPVKIDKDQPELLTAAE